MIRIKIFHLILLVLLSWIGAQVIIGWPRIETRAIEVRK